MCFIKPSKKYIAPQARRLEKMKRKEASFISQNKKERKEEDTSLVRITYGIDPPNMSDC